jgi:hypothetical protein
MNNNPLASFMRQPKIFIRLPSGGNYWEPGALEASETGEYPVYSMTAQDELLLKVPDALMNGQAIVDVIQHCVPSIKNAWKIPNVDIDVVLIALRIATYGEKMAVPVKLDNGEEFEYSLDLRSLLDNLSNQITWQPAVPINEDITVYVKPINYKAMTEGALQTFEMQKIIQLAADDNIPEELKIEKFKESFAKLNKLTIDIINNSIFKIETSAGTTTDLVHIKEFMANSDKTVFDKVKGHIENLREQNNIKPLKISVTPEMKEMGIKTDIIEIPLNFDPTTFFV